MGVYMLSVLKQIGYNASVKPISAPTFWSRAFPMQVNPRSTLFWTLFVRS